MHCDSFCVTYQGKMLLCPGNCHIESLMIPETLECVIHKEIQKAIYRILPQKSDGINIVRSDERYNDGLLFSPLKSIHRVYF